MERDENVHYGRSWNRGGKASIPLHKSKKLEGIRRLRHSHTESDERHRNGDQGGESWCEMELRRKKMEEFLTVSGGRRATPVSASPTCRKAKGQSFL
ncbi:hypothetical protein TSUD_344080 [Trifolium subterraneum]|nr:hypothetical protein TSUD_344080 [Trifolium subterraneum]